VFSTCSYLLNEKEEILDKMKKIKKNEMIEKKK